MIGIIILALNTGTLRISEILYQATHDYDGITNVAFTAGILLFIGGIQMVFINSFYLQYKFSGIIGRLKNKLSFIYT